jgi:hypothetical protein
MRLMNPRTARILCGLSTSVLVALAFASSSTGFPDFSRPYTHDGSSCDGDQDQVDPINFAFKGSHAGVNGSVNNIQWHAGWTDSGGSTQSLNVHISGNNYACHVMDTQRASAGTTSSRFHIRLWRVPANTSPDLTVGDAHHEDFVWYCGHAVDSNGSNGSGFDQGRRALHDAFDHTNHDQRVDYWGNTQNFKQCDGDWAGSNGNGATIGTNHVH